MIRKDCKFYEGNRCKALKRLYCRNEKCVFYKKSCKDELIENQIKTILTKEQYMSNCYKVGGEE